MSRLCVTLSPPNETATFCDRRVGPDDEAIGVSDLDAAIRGGLRGSRLCWDCVEKIVELLRAVRP